MSERDRFDSWYFSTESLCGLTEKEREAIRATPEYARDRENWQRPAGPYDASTGTNPVGPPPIDNRTGV